MLCLYFLSPALNYFTPLIAEPVALRLSTTAHYQLDGRNHSVAEFARLLPKGGHTIHVDNDKAQTEVYTVTLFHQLKCLEIIQQEYVSSRPRIQPLSPVTWHCLNYLKQMFLCRPSLGVESIVNPYAHAVRSYEMVCRNWSKVYAEVERNQEAWKKSLVK